MSTFCEQILLSLEQKGIPPKAAHLQHYFKTGPGGYGEGDVFLGVPVPEQRKIAKAIAQDANLSQLSELVQHPYHEMRLTGLLALVYKFVTKSDGQALFSRQDGARTRQAAGGHGLTVQYARTDSRKYSFAVRAVDSWNRLTERVKAAETGESFKRRLRGISE